MHTYNAVCSVSSICPTKKSLFAATAAATIVVARIAHGSIMSISVPCPVGRSFAAVTVKWGIARATTTKAIFFIAK